MRSIHRETIVKGTTIDSVAIIKSKYNSILIIVMVKHFQGLLNERVTTGMLIERLSSPSGPVDLRSADHRHGPHPG